MEPETIAVLRKEMAAIGLLARRVAVGNVQCRRYGCGHCAVQKGRLWALCSAEGTAVGTVQRRRYGCGHCAVQKVRLWALCGAEGTKRGTGLCICVAVRSFQLHRLPTECQSGLYREEASGGLN